MMREAQWACKPPAGHRVRLSGACQGRVSVPSAARPEHQRGHPEGTDMAKSVLSKGSLGRAVKAVLNRGA